MKKARIIGQRRRLHKRATATAQDNRRTTPHAATQDSKTVCLIVFAWRQHPGMPLILAANRDEFYARPALPAAFWDDRPAVLAGRDLEAGGTWLGISRSGRFAAITNVRDPEAGERRAPRSRGELPADFLAGSMDPGEYLDGVASRAGDYLGFNLLVGDGCSLWYLHGANDAAPLALEPGVFGLSNAALDVPWPKVQLAKQRLRQLLAQPEDAPPAHAQLRACTADRALATQDALSGHGLEMEMARRLSAQFIITPTYGTRCATTLLMDDTSRWDFEEQRFDESGSAVGSNRYESGAAY